MQFQLGDSMRREVVVSLFGFLCLTVLSTAPGYTQDTLTYANASRLSTLYVFPSTVNDKLALEAALRFNPKDAAAHYLLGVWYFARAETPQALHHWSEAREHSPQIPALEASMGLALLHEARDVSRAFETFDAGIKDDPRNIVNYSGAVVAMTLLGRAPRDREKEIERYPDMKQMPNSLVYELALNRAESGDYNGAIDLFRGRFFSREEGGTNVRQVWVEVRLLQAMGLASTEKCEEALRIADTLGAPVTGLSFTSDGLSPFLETPRTRYLLGGLYASCAEPEKAAAKLLRAAGSRGVVDLLWAWAASKKIGNSTDLDSRDRLLTAAAEAEARAKQRGHESLWHYTAGILWTAGGQPDRGNKQLREAFLYPDDGLSHHLARLALTGATPR
jgi:tetratricopeptide (TPR) repeat protein